MVADPAGAALLGDQPGQLGGRVAGDLGEEPPHQPLADPRQAEVVAEADQRAVDEPVGGLAVVGAMSAARFPSRKARMSSSVRIRSVWSVTIMLP